MRKKVEQTLGYKCETCDRICDRKIIVYHEIHGISHGSNPHYILNHLEDFVPLCRSCHLWIHKYCTKYIENKEKFDKLILCLKQFHDVMRTKRKVEQTELK